jgi:uncharacterized lipoprotein YddW (UPF0748 family)
LPEVQNHLIAVVDEVVRNYDIDAIHFDDYFYPYKIPAKTLMILLPSKNMVEE